MKVFSWIHKLTSSGEDVTDKEGVCETPPLKDYPEGLTPLEGYLFKKLQSEFGRSYGHFLLVYQEMWEAGVSSEFDKLDGVSWEGEYRSEYSRATLKLSSSIIYDHLQKVGDCYYLNNKDNLSTHIHNRVRSGYYNEDYLASYIGGCAYELLTLFLNNPRRFKVVTGGLLDTVTGKILNEDYGCCGMTTRVTHSEWFILILYAMSYYEDRAAKLKEIKLKRKEREMLSLYCKCED